VIRKLVFLLLLTIPAAAQDTEFFIERIEVRNHKRVSPDVIVAESRLREGRAYSEEELRDASTRLGRLPFLLSTEFALEKGSERGRHVLVLTVYETKPFFYVFDVQPYQESGRGQVVPERDSRGGSDETFAFGFRWFVGRRGALHVGFSAADERREYAREYAAFAVGYTQYDLFGTRAFATLNLKHPVEGYGGGRISPQFVVGVPVSENQTVTLQYDDTRTGEDEERFDQRLLTARWSYNTTNEPFFPTRGVHVYGGPVVGWVDGAFDGNSEAYAHHSNFYGIEGGAARFFELSERASVWADVRGEWAQNSYRNTSTFEEPFDQSTTYGSIGLGYSHSLWSREERAKGDSRFEATARYSNRRRYYDPEPLILGIPGREVTQVGGAWVRRSSWGTLRLGVGYAW
jgi:outer membrane protein assembly factor BamA